MKKKILAVLFVLVIAALLVALINNKYFTRQEKKQSAAKTIIPLLNQEESDDSSLSKMGDEEKLTSLIPLKEDEVLLDIVSLDFDGDGFDDQINSIKSGDSPYINLLIGLYNQKSKAYERSYLLQTGISQVRTFTYAGIDLTGDHRTALVYQGFLPSGNAVFKAFFISRVPIFSVRNIASLESDGTIFIQQSDRDESYLQSQALGASYPIWVYSSDSANPLSTDQIQTRYSWNREKGIYEKEQSIRVTGSKIAARELAKIQDGTVATFAAFLEGLWYKTENDASGLHYIFFDYNEDRQIIFLLENEEEVYNWQNSNIRRNGIYISTTNLEIENLQRRVDISLRSTDEIRVHVQDDVRMILNESSVWDGYYKKVNFTAMLSKKNESEKTPAQSFVEELEKSPSWKAADGSVIRFANGNYSAIGDNSSDSGRYAPLQVEDKAFIQFESAEKVPLISGIYLVSHNPNSSIILQPYVVMPARSYPLNDRILLLTRNE